MGRLTVHACPRRQTATWLSRRARFAPVRWRVLIVCAGLRAQTKAERRAQDLGVSARLRVRCCRPRSSRSILQRWTHHPALRRPARRLVAPVAGRRVARRPGDEGTWPQTRTRRRRQRARAWRGCPVRASGPRASRSRGPAGGWAGPRGLPPSLRSGRARAPPPGGGGPPMITGNPLGPLLDTSGRLPDGSPGNGTLRRNGRPRCVVPLDSAPPRRPQRLRPMGRGSCDSTN